MNISQGKAGGVSYDVAAAFQGKYFFANIGQSSPTAGEQTLGQIINPSGSGVLCRVRKIFIVPGALGDIHVGFSNTDYSLTDHTEWSQLYGAPASKCTSTGNHSAAASYTVMRILSSVPTTGITLDPLDWIFPAGTHFFIAPSTNNVSCYGHVWWSEQS